MPAPGGGGSSRPGLTGNAIARTAYAVPVQRSTGSARIERHLVRARDLADSRYTDPLTVDDLAAAAHMSRAHFSRAFKRAFGESPYNYLATRRLERAAHLLRHTDWAVADICMAVGLTSVGSFTTSFTTVYGRSPTSYRAEFPPAAALVTVPGCVLRAYGRPTKSAIGEDPAS